MTSPARRGWRLRDQPPAVQRTVRALAAYAAVLLFLTALGLSPNAVLLAAFFLAGTAVVAFVTEGLPEAGGEAWSAPSRSTVGLGRGSDHQTVALARRLAARDAEPGTGEKLAADLQRQLRAVLVDRVRRERGWDLHANPGLAHDALPSDLAAIVVGPVDRRLTDARHLSAILDRIESP